MAEQFGFALDITGNWHEGDGFEPHIRTREPMPEKGTNVRFCQTLSLPAGSYRLELRYDPLLDKSPGSSIGAGAFSGLSLQEETRQLDFQRSPSGDGSVAGLDFSVTEPGRGVAIALALPNTRAMRTRLLTAQALPRSQRYLAVAPPGQGEAVLCHGVPFLMRRLDIRHIPPYIRHRDRVTENRGTLAPWQEGMRFDCGGIRAQAAHFLGMIHNLDIANGSWYSPKGDHGYSHFVGDKAGEIVIEWESGGAARIPLLFGFNLWYGKAWDVLWHYIDYVPGRGGTNFDSTLFQGTPGCREAIRDGLSLTDGIRLMGSDSSNARFIFSVDLGGRRVRSIRVTGVSELYDYPVISAITLERESLAAATPVDLPAGLAAAPHVCAENPRLGTVSLQSIEREAYRPGVEAIKHVLYTFVDELPQLRQPVEPEGYFGPRFDFQGEPLALYAATYLYRNGPECAAYIADSGTGCSSSTANLATVHYTQGMGVWYGRASLFGAIQNWFRLYQERNPGGLPGTGEAWTRGVGELLRECMAFGYDKFVDSYIDWLDRCLFAESNPPHWIRIAGLGRGSEGYRTVKVGDVEEVGNRENDGHGICMWGRYMIWHWMGRPCDWNVRRFPATRAAIEWIQWQLDTDRLRPGTRKDVLYTESECAHGDYDIYSSYNCLHGLKLSIRMAQALGERELVAGWEKLAQRLRQGILDHLVDETPDGPVWHTEETCDWQDHAHKLVHLHLATEGDTYTPLDDYARGDATDRRYLEISRATYRFLMRERNYNCLRMYGYGQGMMTQAALLLDQMEDARRFLDLLLRYCYLPRMEGWASPEGIITHRSMQYYLPVNGYMGQDSHVADSTKAVRLLLGIDDNDPRHLRLVPRYPSSWTRMMIADYPVLTGSSRQSMGYVYERSGDTARLTYRFRSPVERLSVRLGPFPSGSTAAEAESGGKHAPARLVTSGDSAWVWVSDVRADVSGEVRATIR